MLELSPPAALRLHAALQRASVGVSLLNVQFARDSLHMGCDAFGPTWCCARLGRRRHCSCAWAPFICVQHSSCDKSAVPPGITAVPSSPWLALCCWCILQVNLPDDSKQRFLIDSMALYVLKDGCEFEQLMMMEQQGRPEFSFLFDLGSPEHLYYRWRLYSLAGRCHTAATSTKACGHCTYAWRAAWPLTVV